MIAAAMTMYVDNTLATIVVIVSVLTGLGGIAATVFAYGRVKAVESTLQLLRSENDALHEAYDGLRQRAEDEKRSCAEQLAELRGRLDLLTQQFTHSTAVAIAAAVREVQAAPPVTHHTPHLRPNPSEG